MYKKNEDDNIYMLDNLSYHSCIQSHVNKTCFYKMSQSSVSLTIILVLIKTKRRKS